MRPFIPAWLPASEIHHREPSFSRRVWRLIRRRLSRAARPVGQCRVNNNPDRGRELKTIPARRPAIFSLLIITKGKSPKTLSMSILDREISGGTFDQIKA
jgi:hypothetical protein